MHRLAAVASVIERVKPSLNGYCRLRDAHHDYESGAGLLLAVLAMAYCDEGRLGSRDISNLTAQTAADGRAITERWEVSFCAARFQNRYENAQRPRAITLLIHPLDSAKTLE
jgi:hypothetical protein